MQKGRNGGLQKMEHTSGLMERSTSGTVRPFERQMGLLTPSLQSKRITIIGSGSVGSFTTLCLAKMGFTNIEVWDADYVERHNIANQFYRISDINTTKVLALADLIKEFEDITIKPINQRYEGQPLNAEIVISAVDSIDTRIEIMEHIQKQEIPFYIDSRMGGELMRIYSLYLSEKDKTYPTKYFDTLREPEEPAPCTARTILYNVLVIAGMITNLVKKYCMQQQVPYQVICDLNTLILMREE